MKKKLELTILFFFLSLYILTFKGIVAGDNIFHYESAKNFIKTGSFSLPKSIYTNPANKERLNPFFLSEGVDGKIYLALPQGLSIASVPIGSIGLIVENTVNKKSFEKFFYNENFDHRLTMYVLRKLPSAFFIALINPIISALTILIFYKFCFSLTHSYKRSILFSTVLGLSSVLWSHSSIYWTHLIVTFCQFIAFYLIYSYSKSNKKFLIFLSGIFLGYSFITRLETIIFIPLYILFIFLISKKFKKSIRDTVFLLIPIIVFILLQLSWNYFRFGSIFNTGHFHQNHFMSSFKGNLIKAIPFYLFSFSKGFFIFTPVLYLALITLKKFWQNYKILLIFILSFSFFYLLFYSKFIMFNAAPCYGPRFLVPITPFMLLILVKYNFKILYRKILFIFLFSIGFIIQLSGVLGYPTDAYYETNIISHSLSVLKGNIELWWLDSPITIVFGLILISINIFCFIILIKHLRPIKKIV